MSHRTSCPPTGSPASWLWLSVVLLGIGVVRGASADGSEEAIESACSAASDRAPGHQHEGKLREARADLARCAEPTCPASIHDDCARRLVVVDMAMPTIVLAAKDAAGHDLSVVRVTVDGELFADKVDGIPRPIDPGEHHFVFESKGLATFEVTWVLMQGEKDRRERVVLQALETTALAATAPPVAPEPPPAAAPTLATHAIAREARAPARSEPFWQSTWFWGAVGAAALIGGAIYFSQSPDSGDNKIHLQMQVPH